MNVYKLGSRTSNLSIYLFSSESILTDFEQLQMYWVDSRLWSRLFCAETKSGYYCEYEQHSWKITKLAEVRGGCQYFWRVGMKSKGSRSVTWQVKTLGCWNAIFPGMVYVLLCDTDDTRLGIALGPGASDVRNLELSLDSYS